LLRGFGGAVDGQGDIVRWIVVLILGLKSAQCRGSCNGETDSKVLVCVDLAEALEYAEDLTALGQVCWPWHNAQMDGTRRQVRCRSTDRHGGGGEV
jgi:hypothetical protein